MKIASSQHGDVTLVSATDNLDATTFAEAKAYLDAEIAAGHTKLVIDVSDVTFLGSAGLRAILATMQQARSTGGDVRLAGADGNIKRVIDLAGFAKIMKIFATADEAVASYIS